MDPTGSSAERACLLIADISGYTSYLKGVELDHAKDVIADLINTLVGPMHSHFRVNKIEGDAVFLYSPAEEVDGSLLLDLIEASYFAFRRRVLSIGRATTCECGACSLIPHLDVKLVVHHGTVGHQVMLSMDELVGTDVVVVHRLLKNDVLEATGISAYALFTDAVIRATGLEPSPLDMESHVLDLSDIGPTECWIHNLDTAWKREQARRRTYISPEDAIFMVEHQLPGAAPGLVWEWMTAPELRSRWEVGLDAIVESPGGPRRGIGTETHCIHGEKAIVQEVVDWRPPRYVTYRATLFNGEPVMITDEVIEGPEGTAVRKSYQPTSADHRKDVERALADLEPLIKQWFPRLADELDSLADQSSHPEADIPVADEEARLATSV